MAGNKREDPVTGSVSDSAAFDVHATDPARLSAGDGVFEVSGKKFKVIHDGVPRGIYPSRPTAERVYEKYTQHLKTKFAGPEAFGKEIERRLAADDVKGTATIAIFARDQYLLMGKRRDNGKWTMPGGGLEPGEAPLAGAMRELKEEAGINARSLTHLGSETVAGRTGRKVIVHCFCAFIDDFVQTRTANDPDEEVQNWEWIDISGGLSADIAENLQSPRNLLLQKLGLQ